MPPRLGQDRSPRRRVKQEMSSRQILEPFVYALFACPRVCKSRMERQIPPLSIRDAGEEYECGTVAELRPAQVMVLADGFPGTAKPTQACRWVKKIEAVEGIVPVRRSFGRFRGAYIDAATRPAPVYAPAPASRRLCALFSAFC